jgi:hypothetical protein
MRITSVNRFRALVSGAKKTPAAVQNLERSDLPVNCTARGQEGPCSVNVAVKYSTINYKGNLRLFLLQNNLNLRNSPIFGINFRTIRVSFCICYIIENEKN